MWFHPNDPSEEEMSRLGLDLLLDEKRYAKAEKSRQKLMQDHFAQAQGIVNGLSKDFELDYLEDLGELAIFYAAKGKVLFKKELHTKYEYLEKMQ